MIIRSCTYCKHFIIKANIREGFINPNLWCVKHDSELPSLKTCTEWEIASLFKNAKKKEE